MSRKRQRAEEGNEQKETMSKKSQRAEKDNGQKKARNRRRVYDIE